MQSASKIKDITGTNNLAGNNLLELLIFQLRNSKTNKLQSFGINVFKVKEVMETPEISQTPNPVHGMLGIINLRGQMCSVIDLTGYLGLDTEIKQRDLLIITEYNNLIQAFCIDKIDKIVRKDWTTINPPPAAIGKGHITAITDVENSLISIIDVESILMSINPEIFDEHFNEIKKVNNKNKLVYFCDDSTTAINLISKTFDTMNISYKFSKDGDQALKDLLTMADQYGDDLYKHLSLILTDIEMPALDGFTLTKTIKEDKRFNNIPIIIQSSLTGNSNKLLATKIGADGYVDKFNPVKLSQIIAEHIK